MTYLEKLIKETLENFAPATYFKDKAFQKKKNKILNNNNSAKILLNHLIKDEALSLNAAYILLMFDCSVLPLIFEKCTIHPDWRFEFLSIAWSNVSNSSGTKCVSIYSKVLPSVPLLLSDKSKLEDTGQNEKVEIEYLDFRICDEVYLILQTLKNPYFDDSWYQMKDYEERDEEIELFTNTLFIA